jgi:ElaB/YqjD/DUF883 family membrane-anchored ribosome-binding protein
MNTQERNHVPVLDQLGTRAGELEETVARASEGLEESLGHLETRVNEVCESVIDKTKAYSRTANSYVTKNPWAAIGISAGCAFLAGMLIGRRK